MQREIPQNIELESQLLGSIMLNPQLMDVVSGILHEDSFFDPKNDSIYKAILNLYRSFSPITIDTLQAKLVDIGVSEKIGGLKHLAKLQDLAPITINAEYYANEIKAYFMRRKLINEASNQIVEAAYNLEIPIKEVLIKSENALFEVSKLSHSGKGFVTPGEVLANIFETIEARSMTTGELPGIKSGFYDLDNALNGFKAGYYLIMARPSMGKSAIALQMALQMAESGHQVLFFSLEMPKEKLLMRLLANKTSINSKDIEAGRIPSHKWDELGVAIAKLSALETLKIDDTPGLSIDEIYSRCRKAKNDLGSVGAVFIDHMHKLDLSGYKDDRTALTRASGIIQKMCHPDNLNCAVIPLAQLNRDVQGRTDHRPTMADVRECGAIEQDADVMIGVYREEYYKKDTDQRGVTELIILKNRDGELDTIKLNFEPEYSRFRNSAERSNVVKFQARF